MPKVLFVAPSAYTLGGLAVWLDYLLPGLQRSGWETVLGLVSGPRFHLPAAYLAAHPCERWVPVHTETCTPEGRRRAVTAALWECRPDLVVAVNLPDVYAAVGHLRRRRSWSPAAVMALHGLQADLLLDARLYQGALDAVVATNRLACALATEVGRLPTERVFYAPCGVVAPGTRDATGDGGGQRPFTIAWSGRLEQDQKRVRDLPAIVQSLEAAGLAWQLRVAGTGPEEAWLRAHLEAPVRAGRVEFLGHVPSGRMASDLYAQADALLVTSVWETGPLVVWEALASGVPVVSSAYVGSGLEGALQDGHNSLLFRVGDTPGAVTALLRLAHNAALRATLRANGRQLVRARYSLDASVAAWDQALRAVVELPGLEALPARSAVRPTGRLERCLGPSVAETLRVLMRRRWLAAEAGGEWPHSHSALSREEDAAFWQTALRLDCGDAAVKTGPAVG